MKYDYLKTIGLAAGTMLAAAGCTTTVDQPEYVAKTGGKPIYRHFERADVIVKDDRAECLELFNPKKDNISHHVLQVNVKPGVTLRPRTSKAPEMMYVSHGSGMMKINGEAYVLRENSGVYVPAGSTVQLINNSKKPLRCLVILKTLQGIDKQQLAAPLTFDLNAPKHGETKEYDKVVNTKPENLKTEELKPETLTKDENKVQTLEGEKFK